MWRTYLSTYKSSILIAAILRLLADLLCILIIICFYYLVVGLSLTADAAKDNTTAEANLTIEEERVSNNCM